MTAITAPGRTGYPRALPFALQAAAFSGAMVCATGIAIFAGLLGLLLIGYAAMVVAGLAFPRQTALALLALSTAFEPSAIDITGPVGEMIHAFPGGLASALPLTISPVEAGIVAVAVGLLVRRDDAARAPALPMLVWGVPVVIGLGMVYGLAKGGDSAIAYNEARGLLYGILVFFIALRMRTTSPKLFATTALVTSATLASIVLLRYLLMTRGQSIATEVAFAHESGIFMGIGFAIGAALLLRTRSLWAGGLLVAHELLVLAAMMGTGRRSATLVLLAAVVMLMWLLAQKRPMLVTALAIPTILLGSVYLGAYWNKNYGAAAQPARAVRSQIDPTARDQSSDLYRLVEAYDVAQTILQSPATGVGFGRPFIEFASLVSLSDSWPLQLYTPHNNVLWLWLKMGAGIAVVMGMVVLALKRCFVAFSLSPRRAAVPIYPLVLATVLVIYVSYIQVDLALVGTRSTIPLAAALALAFTLPQRPRQARAS